MSLCFKSFWRALVRHSAGCPTISWLDWGYGLWRDRSQSWRTIFITTYQHDLWLLMLTLISWQRRCFSGPSTGKFLFFPPFAWCLLWKKVAVGSPHLRNGELRFPPLRWRMYMHFLEFICTECCFFYLVYWFMNHLFILVWTHGYLFYTLGNKATLLYFVAQFVPALAARDAFIYLAAFWLDTITALRKIRKR